MLDMGFREELEKLLGAAPPDRRTVLFSATLPRPIVELAKRYTREPARVAATPAGEAHADITYRAHLIAPREREHAIVNVLRDADPPSALVFRATREAVQHTATSLGERGFEVVAISGELTQAERLRALKALRDGRARVLVATDVAARGLDLPGIALVLHADLPRDAEALQHRSGRTGRAGRKGVAVLLAAPSERYRLERMLRDAGVAAAEWTPVPTADTIRAGDADRLAADVAALASDGAEEDLAAARRLLEARSAVEVAVALVRRDRARRPAPEELPETARAAREAPARAAEKRAPRRAPADGVWFRLALGRSRQADPRWVLPLLCRRGGGDPRRHRQDSDPAAGDALRGRRGRGGAVLARRPTPRSAHARRADRAARAEHARHAPPRPRAAEVPRRHDRKPGGDAPPPRRSAPAGRRRGPP